MTKNVNEPLSYHSHMMNWAKSYAKMIQDISQGLLAFIPNGLGLLYDSTLKTLPLFGSFFSNRWIEQILKLVSGITLGQSLAADIAHFIFWPIGFVLGAILSLLIPRQKQLHYEGQVGKWLYQVCAQTLGGGFLTLLLLWLLASPLKDYLSIDIRPQHFLWVGLLGALLGLLGKTIFLLAVNAMQASNVAAIQKNVQRAKELSSKLKKIAKQKAKSRIIMQAQDIIQQMNGSESQQYLETFLKEKYEVIALNTHKKLERHFDYLADRACHGDLKALQRLQELLPNPSQGSETPRSKLDVMLERIFNARAIAKIKDDVDTAYDRWQYSFLKTT